MSEPTPPPLHSSTSPPPPRSTPLEVPLTMGQQLAPSGSAYAQTIAKLSRQIDELRLSYAASEEDRRNLQRILSGLSNPIVATTAAVDHATAITTPPATTSTTVTTASITNASAASIKPTYPGSYVNTGMYNSFSLNNADCHAGSFLNTPPFYMPSTSQSTMNMNPMQQHAIIRKCQDLPEFAGAAEHWPMFSTAFKETSAAHGYSNLENLSRLQRALKGEARKLVEALLIHPNSVCAILSTLEFHYGRPEILIRSQLSKVKAFQAILESRPGDIIKYGIMVSNLTVFLENVSASSHLSNPTLLDELVSKLPLSKREEWAKHTVSIIPLNPTVRDFNNWLQHVVKYVAIATELTISTRNENKSKSVNVVYAVGEEQQRRVICLVCKQEHQLYQCPKFRRLTINERWRLVKSNRMCFSCLRSGHAVVNCPYRRECGISLCHRNHNRLLHEVKENKKPVASWDANPAAGVATQAALANVNANAFVSAIENVRRNCDGKTLFKFLPVRIYGPKGSCVIIAFIDEGAKVSLIEESVANMIGVKGPSDSLSLRWIGNKTTREISQRVDFEISGVHKNAMTYQMRNVRTTKNLFLPAQSLNFKAFQEQYVDLEKILVDDYINAMPRILIGFAVHNTKLGSTLFGSNADNLTEAVVSYVGYEPNESYDLDKLVAQYFALENLEIKPNRLIVSEDDKRANAILKETTRQVGNRYETGLLWKNDNITFSESYSTALKRLEIVERKMSKDLEFADWYKNKIKEYVDKQYAKKLSPEKIMIKDRSWYLPHFSVSNANKGNKRRLVFDAAAMTNGMSLNSALLKGPDSYQPKPLLAILFGFRQRKIGVCADIREMFLRINIRKEDQNAQRFLWRGGDQSRQPETYVMSAMIFGSKCSPCSAQYIKNVNAANYKDVYPRAVKAIVDYHYVDDYVDSFDTTEEAIEVARTVVYIHSQAGFELRDFVSNSADFLQAINKSNHNNAELTKVCHGDCKEKILGMYWDARSDEFCFILKFGKMPRAVLDGKIRPTKSQVLSLTMSIFDPLGLLANIIITSKLVLQKLWKANVGWHEEIPKDIYDSWYRWYKKLEDIKGFGIPRCYNADLNSLGADIQLHIFVDASEVAYSAVAYWRISFNGDIHISFVIGKTKCSPLKALSIPRLELQAATLGVRLKEAIVHSHDIKPSEVFLWSDSKTVIHWIRSDTRSYKQFVAHRISEILDYSGVSNWKWVPGKQNPADDATRPRSCPTALADSQWIKGPSFLKFSEDSWPKLPEDVDAFDQPEEKRAKFILSVIEDSSVISFQDFSNYYRLLRVVGWVMRAIWSLKNLVRYRDAAERPTFSKRLSVNEIKRAESKVCQLAQNASYSNEIRLLLSNRKIPKNSPIFKLTPVLDENNVLRLNGRIDKANYISYNTKKPIILPKDHALSKLIARYYHETYHHQNQEAIVCAIRAKFWIPNLRRLVRTTKSTCQLCKNLSATPKPPIMGQLPSDRLKPYVRPFTYTGLDYFGPYYVSIGRRREKRWVAIFTCMTVRAIHLEIAKDLSSDSVILCLRNFINRRGIPVRLRSDCGTNFIGVQKEEWLIIEESIEKECTRRGIEWLFNSPGNPSAGGAWERLIQCVKKVLLFTLKEKYPQVETLQSLLIEAENLVNSRPLTHLPLESCDDEPLTPNHFLLGCSNFIQTPAVDENVCLRKQWHILQQLKQSFWKRWILEYLPTLTRRTKWYQEVEPLQEGDYVIICDENESRGEWKRGKIVKVITAPDGRVRSAEVKTTSAIIKRPASKLAKLDIIGESCTSIHGGRDVAARK